MHVQLNRVDVHHGQRHVHPCPMRVRRGRRRALTTTMHVRWVQMDVLLESRGGFLKNERLDVAFSVPAEQNAPYPFCAQRTRPMRTPCAVHAAAAWCFGARRNIWMAPTAADYK